jgi:hypothetical protein
MSNSVSLAYGIDDENVPTAILIGTDGNVIDRRQHHQMLDAIGQALGSLEKEGH